MNEEFFNRHYITKNENNIITNGFSDAFQQPTETDILINSEGGTQFRLTPGGEENPPLFNHYGIPLYKWHRNKIAKRTQKELDADLDKLNNSPAVKAAELDRQIRENLPHVVAQIYDIVMAESVARMPDEGISWRGMVSERDVLYER